MAGPHAEWRCRSCGTLNPSDYVRCDHCRARRDAPPPLPMTDADSTSPPLAREGGGCARRFAQLAFLGLLAAGAFFYYSFSQALESVEVTGFEWRRRIEVESWSTVRDEAWEQDVPPDAKRLSSRREVHHTEPEQVATERFSAGTRDTGNGAPEKVLTDRPLYRDQPVFGTKVTYEIEGWVVTRTARAEGRDQAPNWPDTELLAGEREARRSEGYTVILAGRREYRKDLPESRWSSLHVGQRLMATVRGGVVEKLE